MKNCIRELRLKRKMTQKELAQKSGVSRNTIIELENQSQRTALLSTLQKLASALGTTVDTFFVA